MNDKQNEKLETVEKGLRHWDPIRVIDFTEKDNMLLNEYDTYAPALLYRLERGDTDDEISCHLAKLRVELMGIGSLPANENDAFIGRKLTDWRDSNFSLPPSFL